ncbi:hypothetical protein ACKWTF_013945 [Chironomus riparius]
MSINCNLQFIFSQNSVMKAISWILIFYQFQNCFAILKIENLDPLVSSNKSAIFYLAENHETFIKFDIDFITSVKRMMVKVDFYKKEGSKFRQLFKSSDIDWCQIVSGKSKTNPLIRTFLMPLINKVPVLSKCPIQGRHNFNVDFDRKMLIMFPSGTYKLKIVVYNNDDNNIATCIMIMKIDDV